MILLEAPVCCDPRCACSAYDQALRVQAELKAARREIRSLGLSCGARRSGSAEDAREGQLSRSGSDVVLFCTTPSLLGMREIRTEVEHSRLICRTLGE